MQQSKRLNVWPSRCMSEFVAIFDNRLSQEGTRKFERLLLARPQLVAGNPIQRRTFRPFIA